MYGDSKANIFSRFSYTRNDLQKCSFTGAKNNDLSKSKTICNNRICQGKYFLVNFIFSTDEVHRISIYYELFCKLGFIITNQSFGAA